MNEIGKKLRIFFYNFSWNITVLRGFGSVWRFNFFQNIVSFYSFKIESFVVMTKIFCCYDTWMVFQCKSCWIISNKWSNPSRKISVLIKRNFEVRNNISETCIENFCNFFVIIYDFILFILFFLRINRFVWKERFDCFPESFIVSYMFFVQLHVFYPSDIK